MAIRVGIYGYGNLGRGVEQALRECPDMTLCGVFTRRDPASLTLSTPGVPVWRADEAPQRAKELDVLILCGGSATDLPKQTPELAKLCCVVDSFDTHACIPEHFAAVDAAAREAGTTAAISVGWDPGMFSLARLYAGAILPNGKDYTFWGKGGSTRCRWSRRSKLCAAAHSRHCRPAKSTPARYMWSPRRAPTASGSPARS